MEFREVGRTLLEGLHEETLGMVEFHEVCRTLLEVLYEETLGTDDFKEVGKNFLEVLHKVFIVVHEEGILYLHVHSNLLHFRFYEVVRKLHPGLRLVILHCRYWSDVLRF